MAQHARVLVVGATSYYHHGTTHIRFCCCCILHAVLWGAWCARGLISSPIAALPRASRWNTVVVHARPLMVPGPRGTREHERNQPRRPSGAHSVAISCTCSLAGGDINMRCCVVYRFIEMRCGRFYVYLWPYVVRLCFSNFMPIYV